MTLKQKIVKIARSECRNNYVKFYLGRGKSVQYVSDHKLRVNGFFDSDPDIGRPKLACAIGRPNWELVLVHELNHLRQWKEDSQIWCDYEKIPGNRLDEAISGKDIDPKELEENIRATILLERDCERRTHNTLKELGYPEKKLKEYVQRGNAYTIFYLNILKTKKWYAIGKEPHSLKSVWCHFPTTFDIDIDKTFKKLGYLYNQCL